MNNIEETIFIFPLRVYIEDTDFGGIVYHANYLRYIERARTEMAIALGWRIDEIAQKHKIFFAVKHLTIDFLAPAKVLDEIEVVTRLAKIGKTSLTFSQDIRLASLPSPCSG